MGRTLHGFKLKTNVALVDVYSPKDSNDALNEFVNLDRDQELLTGITIPQTGSPYTLVKVVAVSDQDFEKPGNELQHKVEVGDYYFIGSQRVACIAGINTTIPQAFVNTQDLLVKLEYREDENNG